MILYLQTKVSTLQKGSDYMSVNCELGRLKMKEWTTNQREKEALEKYTEAKERANDAYATVQATWKKRCEAKDNVAHALEVMQNVVSGKDNSLTAQDAIMTFRRAQVMLGRAKNAHEAAQGELRSKEFERDRLKKELEVAEAEHASAKKELDECLAKAQGQ